MKNKHRIRKDKVYEKAVPNAFAKEAGRYKSEINIFIA
jgi:hypothetical protein